MSTLRKLAACIFPCASKPSKSKSESRSESQFQTPEPAVEPEGPNSFAMTATQAATEATTTTTNPTPAMSATSSTHRRPAVATMPANVSSHRRSTSTYIPVYTDHDQRRRQAVTQGNERARDEILAHGIIARDFQAEADERKAREEAMRNGEGSGSPSK